MATYNAIITNAGRSLLANAASGGGQVIPVRINTGDGALGATDPSGLTSLIHLVQSYSISSSNALVPYQASFQFIIDSSTVTSTYALREIGLIGKLGSTGAETLIYYSNTTDPPDTITPATGQSAVLDFNTLTIAFSNTPNTVATLTAAIPPALHAISHLHRMDGSSPDPIPTANSADYGLCPSTPSDATKVLLGGATAAFGSLPLHGPTHVGTGIDPVPLSTTAASGALRALSGDATTALNGTGNWVSPFFPGFIAEYGGAVAPPGWLMADGSAVSRSLYPGLFNAIGVLHGPGDGSTTFNLPDCRGRATIGAGNGPGLTPRGLGAKGGEESHTLSLAEMPVHSHGIVDNGHAHSIADPSHAHSIADPSHSHPYIFGNISGTQGLTSAGPPPWYNNYEGNTGAAYTHIGIYGAYTGIGIYASGTGIALQNAGGGAAHNIVQPFVVLNKIIHV